jgi:hypothetical protein
MKNIITPMLAALALLSASCEKDVLRGSGAVVTETRQLAPFHNIQIDGTTESEVVFSTESKVEITGYQNLVNEYLSEVNNLSLKFRFRNLQNIRNNNLRVKIYTPNLRSVSLSGDLGMVIGEGFKANSFYANLSGITRLEWNGGEYKETYYDVSGNAKLYARLLKANSVVIEASGNTKAEATALEQLDATASGTSEIAYWGRPPIINIHLTGRAKVERK